MVLVCVELNLVLRIRFLVYVLGSMLIRVIGIRILIMMEDFIELLVLKGICVVKEVVIRWLELIGCVMDDV